MKMFSAYFEAGWSEVADGGMHQTKCFNGGGKWVLLRLIHCVGDVLQILTQIGYSCLVLLERERERRERERERERKRGKTDDQSSNMRNSTKQSYKVSCEFSFRGDKLITPL